MEARKASKSIDGFNWDNGNWPKCEQHGVSKAAIEWALTTPFTQLPDPHDGVEERFRAIGNDETGRYLFIVFCLREMDNKTLIRPISARYMHRKEIEAYERQR